MRDITDHDPRTLRFAALEEEYDGGYQHPEDGSPDGRMYGLAVFVQAESPEGVRFRKLVGASDWVTEACPESGDPIPVRTQDPDYLRGVARQLAERLEACSSPRLDRDTWDYAGCAYGSEAYQLLGCEAEAAALERKEWGVPDRCFW